MNIVQALSHPDLLEGEFPSPAWDAWQLFLRCLFGLKTVLGPKQRKLYRECTGRSEWPTAPFREACLIVGRRGGKSRILALIATYLATCIDWTPKLAVGETAIIAVIASDRDQAKVILGYARGLLRSVEVLDDLVDADNSETLRLSNRVTIEIHVARISAPRGRTFAAVLCDEIAFWKAENSTSPDEDVVNAVRPGLATLAPLGSMLLLASSPYARRGVLWTTYRKHFGKDDSRTLVWRAPTLIMHPSPALKEVVDQAFEDDPVAASAEYGGEFRSDIAAFVSREIIDAVTTAGLHETMPQSRIIYSAFTDPSGGSGSDSFTLAIGHREGDKGVLDCIRERRPPLSPESVVQEYAELMKRYRISSVTGDRYAGEWPAERFREHGISYEPSERTKSQIYQELLPLLNSGRVELLDNARLATQLVGLERRTVRGGKDSIDHSPGSHDDIANSAAGVLVQLAGVSRDAMSVWQKLSPSFNAKKQEAAFGTGEVI